MLSTVSVTGDNTRTFHLLQPIGEGLTAVIWRGVEETTGEEVALKLLRAGAGAQVEQLFWQEADALAQLNRVESAQANGVSAVPRLRGVQRQGEPRFIAMDLAQGESLEHFLEPEDSLSEIQVLAIVNQLLRVLDLLHTQLQQTRRDFSLRDLYVDVGNETDEPRLWMLDWAALTTATPETISTDLARVGELFYRLLTFKAADPRGEAEHLLAQRGGAQWENITAGTRHILARALHPNPQNRYARASEFRHAAQAQLSAWELDWADLLAQAQDELDAAELDADSARRIENALDLAVRKGGGAEKIAYYRAAFEKKTQKVSAEFITAQEHYRRGEYARAAEVWHKEAAEAGRIELWRWALAARVGVDAGEQFPILQADLEQALDSMNALETNQALEILDKLVERVNSPALEALGSEASAREYVKQARRLEKSKDAQAWQPAAENYAFADTLLEALPYGKLIREQEGWGNLNARAALMERRQAMRAQLANARLDLAVELERDWQNGARALQDALQNDPTNETLLQLCLDAGTRAQERNDQARAVEMFEIGLLWGNGAELYAQLQERYAAARRTRAVTTEPRTAWLTDPSAESAAHATLEANARIAELESAADQQYIQLQQLELVRMLDKRFAQLVWSEFQRGAARTNQLEQELHSRALRLEAVLVERDSTRARAQQTAVEQQKAFDIFSQELARVKAEIEKREIQIQGLIQENEKLKKQLAPTDQPEREAKKQAIKISRPLAEALAQLQILTPESADTAERQLKNLVGEYERKGGDALQMRLAKRAYELAQTVRKPLLGRVETILTRHASKNKIAAGVLSSRDGLEYLKKNPLAHWLRDEQDRLRDAQRANGRGDARGAVKYMEQVLRTQELAELVFQELWREFLGDDPALAALAPLENLKRERAAAQALYETYRKAALKQK